MKTAIFLGILLVLLGQGLFFNVSAQGNQVTCTQYCNALRSGQTPPPLPPGVTCICNPLETQSFIDLINNILTFIFNVALMVTPIMVIIAGYLFLTAGGKPQQITNARNLLLWTGVGLAIIILSKGLVNVLRQIIGF